MDEGAHLARLLLFDVIQRIEILDFAGETDREILRVKFFDVVRAILSLA